ncbi:MAG TPA: PAS domain S-box protein [Terriglobales bacterium]|nr:PAS domain S-box protein [Terriglobales bacterium]
MSASLAETFPEAVVAVDREGTILQINRLTEELFGYRRDELVGQKIEVLVPEPHRAQHHDYRTNFAERPRLRRMGAGLELRGRRRDGSEFPVEISLSPVCTERGVVVFSAIRDITDRKQIEEELRRANRELEQTKNRELLEYQSRLALIVDSSEDAIIGKNLDGVITTWNQGAERIYGYTAEEIVGQHISVLAPADRPEEIPQILEKIRRGERVEQFESVRVAKGGRFLNVSVSVSPVRNPEGIILGASIIARDITAQKRVEDQLRQLQKMEAIGRLAGGVAHDFNNILAIVTACTELLRDRVQGQEAALEYVDAIRKGTERGAALTRQLLAFSRKQVVQPRLFDLNERLQETSKLLQPLMGDDVEIRLVPRTEAALVDADPGQLDQIILNLAVNARDAMPRGGRFVLETALVEVDEAVARASPPLTTGKYVMLAVSDTGTGMDQQTVSRIFEPFFTTKEMGKGTGLGLSTVYGIVQQNAGTVSVYSEPGRGTTFKIYLPSAEHKVGMISMAAAETAPPRAEGTTILLVEDDEMMRSLTRQMLEEHGYRVLEANDGNAALRQTGADRRIALVLTDVVMLGMSGPEFALRLAESDPAVKVVYMSGYTGELVGQTDQLRPGVNLLEKPFTRAALLRAIQRVLE